MIPSLYRLAMKTCVKGMVNRSKKAAARANNKLHNLPASVLMEIIEEMSPYSVLSRTLHRELSDPDLFIRLFMANGTIRMRLERCLAEASLIGKSVLPDVVRNWCKVMGSDTSVRSVSLQYTQGVLELGTYLHEGGWAHQSVKVLRIALRMIPKDNPSLKIECVQKILRAEGSALLRAKADVTCNKLLAMIADNAEDEVRLKVFLEVANHHYKAQRYEESDRWTLKALELISETTKAEIIIEFLQLKALYLFRTRHNDTANLVIRQAIYRARQTFGHHHRRYADTLYTYGVSLLRTNCCWNAIQILLELLGIITSLYGKFTPHVEDIESYLAFGFNRLSQATGRIGPNQNRIHNTIRLAETIMRYRGLACHFGAVRTMIIRGRDDFLDASDKNRIAGVNDNEILPVEEIKQLCFQLSENFSLGEPSRK
ncbi:amyloid protein-binding protein 2-like [Aedes aegypti]|uniref:Uncharacterized protein n=1 Tax=Aedes aegypti TaxID=7159 RepID=A0A6I8TRR2_AEDAE|nr:amyloid protein-binding protein 2-like [Aedes aegypti]